MDLVGGTVGSNVVGDVVEDTVGSDKVGDSNSETFVVLM